MRYALLAAPRARVQKPSAGRLLQTATQLLWNGEARQNEKAIMLALQGMNALGAVPAPEESLKALAAELTQLDRYERRPRRGVGRRYAVSMHCSRGKL